MNILFLGSGNFAIFPLYELSKTSHKITLITKEDKPKGRGLRILKSPLVSLAEDLGIMVIQNDEISIISSLSPDLIIVVSYGKILKKEILSIPRYGAYNLHPSLLPKYRGPAPINWALINGEEKTGITIFLMDENIDAGEIVLQKEVEIFPNDDYESLSSRLSKIGGECLQEAISLITQGSPRKKQEGTPSYAPKIKEAVEIDFNDENRRIFNLIRGFPKDPGVWMNFDNERIKILKASICEKEGRPGEILESPNSFIIGCKKGSIILDIVQRPGKRPISGFAFLCGIKGKKNVRITKIPGF